MNINSANPFNQPSHNVSLSRINKEFALVDHKHTHIRIYKLKYCIVNIFMLYIFVIFHITCS